MSQIQLPTLKRAFVTVAGLLILKVTAEVILGYRNYLPPDFRSEFLRGREHYFWGKYHWAFYAHIASGPVALLMGMVLISERFRLRYPKWHRYLGRLQVANLLLVVAPSGLWMSWYAAAGPIGGLGLAVLAILTALCVTLGWRAAVRRRFAEHRRWMWRCFLLLCSAVVLRILGGLANFYAIDAEWFNPLANWASWILPVLAFELACWNHRVKHEATKSAPRTPETNTL